MRSAQHFDAVDFADQKIGEVEARLRRRGIVQFHAVDEHQGLRGLRAAQIDRGRLTDAAIAAEGDARRLRQQIGQGDRLTRLDCGAIENGDGIADLIERFGPPIGDHDERFGNAIGLRPDGLLADQKRQ